MADIAKADIIATELRRKGYNIVWREATEDQIVVAIDFMDNRETPWVRAFHLDAVGSDPKMFVREIEDWKKGVLDHYRFGMVSDTVRHVLQRYGSERFEAAMKAKV